MSSAPLMELIPKPNAIGGVALSFGINSISGAELLLKWYGFFRIVPGHFLLARGILSYRARDLL